LIYPRPEFAFYFLMISARQWADSGIKEPIKIKPTAKIKDAKLIHLFPFNFLLY